MIDLETANILYSETLADLKGAIEVFELPDHTGPSIQAFCKYYKIARSNLFHCFGGKGDLGVGLYMKIAGILGILGTEYVVLQNLPVHNISLRWFLCLDSSAVKDSMIKLRFEMVKSRNEREFQELQKKQNEQLSE
jgi:hypothetical protein